MSGPSRTAQAMQSPEQVYRAAIAALNQSRWAEASALATQVLRSVPDHGGVHFVAGVAALQLQQLPGALRHLQRAVRLSPTRPDYAAQYARALAAARLLREATLAAEQAMALGAADPLTLDTLGVVFTQANAHRQAVEAFRRAAALMPGTPSYRFNLATSLTFIGEIAAAEQEYEACLRLDPQYWKAHLALSQLRRQSAGDNHIDRLRGLLDAWNADGQARLYLNLALAKELEDLGEYPAAFTHLVAGKSAGGTGRDYATARDEALFSAIEQAAAPGPVTDVPGPPAEPIFIIGMPRSGTTLVDRILSSHPDVHSAGELQNFGVLLKRASGSRTPALIDVDTVARAGGIDWSALGEAYIASTRPGTGHTPRFTDKLPHNFLYAGFIARALPGARIVCLRRNPMDTCLSNFRQLFALSSPYYDYSFDLLDTGRYYVLFDRLMSYWKATMPGRILELEYEELLDDQEGRTRELLEFCGLPWNEACLRFERNEAPVATASAVQVRAPLNRGSLHRWKRYEHELEGLRGLLERHGIATG